MPSIIDIVLVILSIAFSSIVVAFAIFLIIHLITLAGEDLSDFRRSKNAKTYKKD